MRQKNRFLEQKIAFLRICFNLKKRFFSQCYPLGTHGFPKNNLPFGPAVWPDISEELYYIDLQFCYYIQQSKIRDV